MEKRTREKAATRSQARVAVINGGVLSAAAMVKV